MKALFGILTAMGLAAAGCQPGEFIDPEDQPTGTAPEPGVIFSLSAAHAPRFLDANLEATTALTAEFVVAGGAIRPIAENGAMPASAGADANLRAGVGFGTYANPDLRGAGVTWAEADRFRSVVEAEVVLSQAGDAVRFCRSFGTNCVTVTTDPTGQSGLVKLTAAANIPDTEIGVIAEGIAAAIRGTGPRGLTIAVADPTRVAAPFTFEPATPFTLRWEVARGATPGSLDYTVSIDGTEVTSVNTAEAMASAVTATGGVALMFDAPFSTTANPAVEFDYSYDFAGDRGEFRDPLGLDVPLSPQLGLGVAPLQVYPTRDPNGFELLTLSGTQDVPHLVQPEDGIVGMVAARPGVGRTATIVSTAFNGDDFAGTGAQGAVDQGIEGGGFYPSPSLCYAQILPTLSATVAGQVRRGVHQRMYGAVANGVLASDAALDALSMGLASLGVSVPYTRVGDAATGDMSGYITVGTDYADNNVDAAISTSVTTTYAVTLQEPVSQTFRTELSGILGALEANNNAILTALIDQEMMTMEEYRQLKTLQFALTESPGSKDGVIVDGAPVVDNGTSRCNGYDCNVKIITRDVINGTNETGSNPAPGTPALAAICLWGQRPAPEQPAQDATLTGNPLMDHPAYPATPARPAVPPVREVAAAAINGLVMGIFGNFVTQAFGPTVPASVFSLSMDVGDTQSGQAPAVTSIRVLRE